MNGDVRLLAKTLLQPVFNGCCLMMGLAERHIAIQADMRINSDTITYPAGAQVMRFADARF